VVHEIPAEWLPVRCEMKRPAGTIGRDCRACARNVCQEPLEVNITSTCNLGQKLGVSLPLLTCSPSAWPSRLLYRRGRKSRRDSWITLYMIQSLKLQSSLLLLKSVATPSDTVSLPGRLETSTSPHTHTWCSHTSSDEMWRKKRLAHITS